MRDYERSCFTAYPDPDRGYRDAPELTVIEVMQVADDEYEVWFQSPGTKEWWHSFNDWMLSYVTSPTWIPHHSTNTVVMLSGRDAMWFKLQQKVWDDE